MKKYISEYTITQLSKCKLLITGKTKALYYVKSYHVDDFTIPSLILSSVKFKGDCVVVVRFVQKLTGDAKFFCDYVSVQYGCFSVFCVCVACVVVKMCMVDFG